jgi:hypothetical protein
VVCQFHIVEVASGEMVESRKMGWKMGENVVVECEGNETGAGEKSRRRDFPLWGITESKVLNIPPCSTPHPFVYTIAGKPPLAIIT